MFERKGSTQLRRLIRGRTAGVTILAGLTAALTLAGPMGMAGCGPKPTTQPAADDAPQPSRTTAAESKPPDDAGDLAKLPGCVHIVQPGDTLYSIAEHYYGHGKYYGKIFAANRNRLVDPKELPVGMRLIIPP